jgi:hypothetical protein
MFDLNAFKIKSNQFVIVVYLTLIHIQCILCYFAVWPTNAK